MSPIDFTLLIRRYSDAVVAHHHAVTSGSMSQEIEAAKAEINAAKSLLEAAAHTPPDDSTLEDLLFS